MSFTTTYDTGTPVLFGGGNPGKAASFCTGIVAAGPVQMYCLGLVLLRSPGTQDYLITILDNADYECIVPILPDGIETGTFVRIETTAGTYYGHIMATVAPGPHTFQRSVLNNNGIELRADDWEISVEPTPLRSV